MVTYGQLKDAKFKGIQDHIDGWIDAKNSATSTRNTANTKVAGTIANGKWKGRTSRDAQQSSRFLVTELDSANVEIDAIKWILWWAKGQFKAVKRMLDEVIELAEKNGQLTIDPHGVVRADMSGFGKRPSGAEAMEATINKDLADEYSKRIRNILMRATGLDALVASKLKAAANMDDASNPGFNGQATTDGHIPKATQRDLMNTYKMFTGHKVGRHSLEEILGGGKGAIESKGEIWNDEKYAKYWAEQTFHEDRRNGPRDAMKHILGTALIAQRIGEFDARLVASSHETVPNNPQTTETMDLHNNEIGYRLARENPNASQAQLMALAKQQVEQGNAIQYDKAQGGLLYTDGLRIPR